MWEQKNAAAALCPHGGHALISTGVAILRAQEADENGTEGSSLLSVGATVQQRLPSASAGQVRGLIPGSQVEQKKSPPLSPPEGRLSLSPYQNPSSIREASRSTALWGFSGIQTSFIISTQGSGRKKIPGTAVKWEFLSLCAVDLNVSRVFSVSTGTCCGFFIG